MCWIESKLSDHAIALPPRGPSSFIFWIHHSERVSPDFARRGSSPQKGAHSRRELPQENRRETKNSANCRGVCRISPCEEPLPAARILAFVQVATERLFRAPNGTGLLTPAPSSPKDSESFGSEFRASSGNPGVLLGLRLLSPKTESAARITFLPQVLTSKTPNATTPGDPARSSRRYNWPVRMVRRKEKGSPKGTLFVKRPSCSQRVNPFAHEGLRVPSPFRWLVRKQPSSKPVALARTRK